MNNNLSWLNAQLADTKRLYEMAKDHPIMGPNLKGRIEELESKILKES